MATTATLDDRRKPIQCVNLRRGHILKRVGDGIGKSNSVRPSSQPHRYRVPILILRVVSHLWEVLPDVERAALDPVVPVRSDAAAGPRHSVGRAVTVEQLPDWSVEAVGH